MKQSQSGLSIVELLIVIIIISVIASIGYASYANFSVRAKNSAIITGIDQLRKTIELYRVKRGVYPLQQYANTRYYGTHSSPTTVYPPDNETGSYIYIKLLLNNPETIKQLSKDAQLAAQLQQDTYRLTNPQFHGLWGANLSYRPGYFDTAPPLSSKWISLNSNSTPEQWRDYADYISRLFGGIQIPSIYDGRNKFSAKRQHSHGGRERVALGVTYELYHRVQTGTLSVLLTYGLHGDTDCVFSPVVRSYEKYDNITVCTIQLNK